ncbi:glycosyltransferase family 2 protein [Salegentibacter sp. F188]|uniref:Glycosyltransferase family 2 protein n=1 Tax=Autumnicola patrickiae TaxID=3075591 RepID=A0ABU3DXA2_9FLAO|nr:glycosyltransferase family 2 protein [Salegentibacter sp. F188]MDT0688315.1 glycosyltransferase family 2 protein [Salegentibacter sp. F188]
MKPEVSIIIPTFNRAHTIEETIDCVMNQTHQKWECLVVDDGSTDGTEELLKTKFSEDSRFIYIQRPKSRKKGAASCRNLGLEKAEGKFIQFLDSDDLIAENKLEEQTNLLKNAPLNSLATSKWGRMQPNWEFPMIYEKMPTYFSSKNPRKLLDVFGNQFTYFPPHVYLLPSGLIKKAGIWDEELSLSDDGEFFCRMILGSSNIVFSPKTYAIYKTGAGNRLNGLLSEEGIASYIKAWTLNEKTILHCTGVKNHVLVRQAKLHFYKRMKKHNPSVIKEHPDFFNSRMSSFEYLFLKTSAKLNSLL